MGVGRRDADEMPASKEKEKGDCWTERHVSFERSTVHCSIIEGTMCDTKARWEHQESEKAVSTVDKATMNGNDRQ